MSVVPIRYVPDEDEPEHSLDFLHPRYNSRRYHLPPHLQTLSQFEKNRRSLRSSRQDDSALPVKYRGKDGFRVSLDMEQFDPNEITIRTDDNHIIVEARDYVKEDKDGFFKRRFIGRYNLPKEFDVKDLVATLTPNGLLTVKVPPTEEEYTSSKFAKIPRKHLPVNLSEQEQNEINEYELDEDERG